MLDSGSLPHAFEFHAAVIPFPQNTNQTTCAVVFEIPISALHFKRDTNRKLFGLHASVLALFKNASGRVVGKVSRDLPYEIPLENFDEFRKGVLTDIEQIELPPGRYTVAVAVLDSKATSASARRIAVIVPGNDGGPVVSGISVLRRIDAIPNGEVNPFDPLQFSGKRAIPGLSQSIFEGPEAKAVVFFVIYPQKSDQPAKLAIDLMQNGHVLVHSEPALDSPNQHGSIPYLATIPASTLKPGDYQIVVKVTQGSKIAQQQTWFDIDHPQSQPAKIFLSSSRHAL